MHHEYIKYIQSENKWNLSTIKNPEHRQKKLFVEIFASKRTFTYQFNRMIFDRDI